MFTFFVTTRHHAVGFGGNLEEIKLTPSRTFLHCSGTLFPGSYLEKTKFKICSSTPGGGKNQRVIYTPGTMNSLFSDFFRNFSGVFLGVVETIWGSFWWRFGRNIGRTSGEKTPPNQSTRLFKIALNSLFTDRGVRVGRRLRFG